MKIIISALLDWIDDGIDSGLSLLEFIYTDKLISEIGISSYILLMLLINDRTKFAKAEQNNENGKERRCKDAHKRPLMMLRDIFKEINKQKHR